jgi:hypothetical protein
MLLLSKKSSKLLHNQKDIVLNTMLIYHKVLEPYVVHLPQEILVSDSNLTSMTEMMVILSYHSVPISVGDPLGISMENSNSSTDLISGGEETGTTVMSE